MSRSVIAPVLDLGGLFKGYDLHKVAQLSTSIEEMDAVTLNYWLSEFVMEVAKKSGKSLTVRILPICRENLTLSQTPFWFMMAKATEKRIEFMQKWSLISITGIPDNTNWSFEFREISATTAEIWKVSGK